jgi:hypothetical protein
MQLASERRAPGRMDSIVTNESPAICVRLDGGLGNQMFQYAFGVATAHRRRVALRLDASGYMQAGGNVTKRSVAVDAFRIRGEIVHERCVRGFALSSARRLPWVAKRLGICCERSLDFDEGAATDATSHYFQGYWQSFRYFEEVTESLVRDFQPHLEIGEVARDFIRSTESVHAVMVHVRRGDYVALNSASAFHGALDVAHYCKTISTYLQRYPSAHFFIFSDDVRWCRSVDLGGRFPVTYMDPSSERSDLEDLMMMASCRGQIIANSSFSWWSAWLSDRRYGVAGRCVIAPSRWFAGASYRMADRFPSHWDAL